jgi:hypothetical protein
MDDAPKNDGLMILLGFIGILLVLWLASGGPNRPGAYVPPREPAELPGLSIELPSIAPWKDATSSQEYTRSAVALEVEGGRTSVPSDEYLVLEVNKPYGERTLVTGWSLRSDNTGIIATIGKGAYTPLYGSVNNEEDIYLNGSGKVFVTSGRSPLGVSFEVNKCSGFLGNTLLFTPELPRSCPAAERLVGSVDRVCSDYLRGLSLCQIPTSLPTYLSASCKAAIAEKLHYNSCVQTTRGDIDFSSNEWRVYLKSENSLWRDSRDFIRLIDQLGNTLQTAGY